MRQPEQNKQTNTHPFFCCWKVQGRKTRVKTARPCHNTFHHNLTTVLIQTNQTKSKKVGAQRVPINKDTNINTNTNTSWTQATRNVQTLLLKNTI